ncbi:MAG: hypothetical protein ABJA94_00920 [Rhodoglobus sp.]
MPAPVTPSNPMEDRLPVSIVTVLALVVYFFLPSPFGILPTWLVPAIGLAAITPLVIFNPRQLNRQQAWTRWIGVGFAIGLTIVNQVYVVAIIHELINGAVSGPGVLLTAAGVWTTDVIAFSLVYWELDKGGPVARRIEGLNDDARQDFRFPQQDNTVGVEGWMPEFFDYAYFTLSNMMAFSPTDVMPLTRRAKGLMAFQALTGFVILALVISRAVNILT